MTESSRKSDEIGGTEPGTENNRKGAIAALMQWANPRWNFVDGCRIFSATGSRDALEKLGAAMQSAFRDDAALRDVLSRAELD